MRGESTNPLVSVMRNPFSVQVRVLFWCLIVISPFLPTLTLRPKNTDSSGQSNPNPNHSQAWSHLVSLHPIEYGRGGSTLVIHYKSTTNVMYRVLVVIVVVVTVYEKTGVDSYERRNPDLYYKVGLQLESCRRYEFEPKASSEEWGVCSVPDRCTWFFNDLESKAIRLRNKNCTSVWGTFCVH